MKYKIGDKVTVKKGLNSDTRYGGVAMIFAMSLQGGKTFTIKEIDYTTFSVPTYRFNEFGGFWTDEMLEEKETDPMSVVENGNIVQVARGEYFLYLDGKGYNEKGWTQFKTHQFKIVKIWKIADILSSHELVNPKNCIGELIWEEPKPAKEMTIKEIEEKLGYNIKVIKEEEF